MLLRGTDNIMERADKLVNQIINLTSPTDVEPKDLQGPLSGISVTAPSFTTANGTQHTGASDPNESGKSDARNGNASIQRGAQQPVSSEHIQNKSSILKPKEEQAPFTQQAEAVDATNNNSGGTDECRSQSRRK